MNLVLLYDLKRFGDFECRKKCCIWMINISFNFTVPTDIIKTKATGRNYIREKSLQRYVSL